MILEVMQQKYLAQASGDLVRELPKLLAAAQQDPLVARLIADEQVTIGELRETALRLELIAADLAEALQTDPAFMPRDGQTAQLQSALQRYYLEHRLTQTAAGLGLSAADHPISDISLSSSVTGGLPKRLFGEKSQTDVRWISCWLSKAFVALRAKREFPDRPAPPQSIANDARVYLVGDWGSGVSRARKIGDRVRAMLLDETRERDQHVVHLGDVYYSGWPQEYDDHFLAHWPVRAGEEHRFGSWSLNSNHDMYSGGSGYFDHMLKDSRFKAQGHSSYFSLENDHWLILGLDSAFEDGTLAGGQFEWVEEIHRRHPVKKLMLMTHHQPFSAFERDFSELWRLMARNRVNTWFWGHEHRFAVYAPREELPHGRLIGHSGVPVWAQDDSQAVKPGVTYLGTRGFDSGLERFALFGFAVLDFAGPQIRVSYVDEHGEPEWTEVIE